MSAAKKRNSPPRRKGAEKNKRNPKTQRRGKVVQICKNKSAKLQTPADGPEVEAGLSAIAARLAGHFKIQCQRQYIVQWRKQTPVPFPAPRDSNRFNVAECIKWVEQYKPEILNGATDPTGSLFHQAAEAEARAKIGKEAHDAWLHEKEKGLWILRAVAKNTVAGALKKYHGFIKAENERGHPAVRQAKLVELGIAPELCAQFLVWDIEQARLFTDRIEEECAAAGRME